MHLKQVLCVTCDNASNNETMLEHLENFLLGFSSSNHAWHFAHILNLVAKSFLKQFEVDKKSEAYKDLSDKDVKLLDLKEDIELEELTTGQETEEIDDEDSGDREEYKEDDLDDWVDEVSALTPDERETLEDDIRPIKMALVKVSHKND